jgi:hypothetical protein
MPTEVHPAAEILASSFIGTIYDVTANQLACSLDYYKCLKPTFPFKKQQVGYSIPGFVIDEEMGCPSFQIEELCLHSDHSQCHWLQLVGMQPLHSSSHVIQTLELLTPSPVPLSGATWRTRLNLIQERRLGNTLSRNQ